MNKVFKLGAIILPLLLIQGCSSDDDNNAPVTVDPQPAVSVFDAAQDSEEFTTLVAALEATGLDETLDDLTTSYTVFAPTDDAFALLGEETINSLLADTDTLSSILTYHVIAGRVDAQTAIGLAGSTVETVNGQNIALSLNGENLLVNTSTVTMTDIVTDNGIIHVIDAVLTPKTVPETAPTNNIIETAQQAGNFSTLLAALDAASLTSALADESSEFTVFAPTDAAFEAIGSNFLNTLLANPTVLADILKQHVLVGSVDSVTAMSLNGQSAETLLGNTLPVAINAETNMLSFGGANIVVKDIMTTNGVIHVIDSVIISDVTLPQSTNTIADIASADGNFTTLLAALTATGLDTLVADPDNTFSVFAPTDAAFAALGQDTINALLADTDTLRDILLYHVFPDATVLSDDAVSIANSNSNKIEMANGDMAAISYVDSSLFINDSAITEANVTASNGVIHVLNKVIMPPAEVGTPTKTIATVATETPALSTLVTALQAASLVDTFNDTTQSFTVFAPTNAAFSKIPTADLEALLADTTALTGVLTQHVLGAQVGSTDAFAANGKTVTTLADNMLSVNVVDFTSTENTATDSIAYDSTNNRLVTGMADAMPGKTVYVFDNDLGEAMSTCEAACATTWPPVLGTAASIENVPGLSLIARSDDSMQVAYLGRPLYTFSGDTAAGQNNGQAVNDIWWQVSLPATSLQVAGSNVTTTDIYTSNGVVHLIDTVITTAK
ncbi:fasciclin domain-containing protein [Pseudoalteromonas sp. 2CM39R]|uniref:fasciclin domain-containing protein n=1 Tax=Pseudoalteromonas TaxID=53246 RepID=UPI0006BA7E96|nr:MULTISPECIES: fasciclin domain-containing protein [Pseudoalteromonas]KPH91126.1 adhesin [Pseudoalteromonas undina]MCK8129019.1 fasciclin domain-containing protein [Pseudoalteromonas sp. 2CM39R]